MFASLFLNTRNNLIDKRILGLGITRQLVDAGKILNISVLDHIIGYNDAEQKAVSISLRESGMVVFNTEDIGSGNITFRLAKTQTSGDSDQRRE